MPKKSRFVAVVFPLMLVVLNPATAQVQRVEPDPAGVQLLNKFMDALANPDEKARLAAVIPLVHKSLLTNDGKDLFSSVKQFAYKRAVDHLKFYDVPPRLHQVHTLGVQTVGGGANAEKGRRDKYFVKKKEGQNGMPAPVHIFFPASGGEPKILDFGSF